MVLTYSACTLMMIMMMGMGDDGAIQRLYVDDDDVWDG